MGDIGFRSGRNYGGARVRDHGSRKPSRSWERSDPRQFYFLKNDGGLVATQPDGQPLWGYSRATHVLVAPDGLYPFDRELLSRLDSNGQVRWTLPVDDSTNVIRSSSRALFVAGIAYIRAISPEGQQLWRMQLPEFREHELVLSDDEKTLYIATNRRLYAIDSQRGHVSWATENSCTASFLCPPQPMADGSLAIKSRDSRTSKSRLRIFDASGKEMSASEPAEDFDYLVPTASNIVITSRNYVLEAVDRRNKILWTKGDPWQLLSPSLSRSRRPASFYACNRGVLNLMGANGESRFAVPESGQFEGSCSSTYEGPGNLLFVRHYNYASHLETLWTVRLPESQP